MTDKTILIVQLVHPADKVGGGPIQSFLVAKGLADLGWKVVFAAQREDPEGMLDETFLDKRIKVYWLKKVFPGLEWLHIPKLYCIIRKEKIEVLFTHIYTALIGVLAILKKMTGLTFVYMRGTIIFCKKQPLWVKGYIGRYNIIQKLLYFSSNVLSRIGIKFADIILAQTEEQKEMYKKNFGRDSIVYAGPSILYKEDKEVLEFPEKPFILWIGNLVPVKRPEILFEIARQMPDYQFVMAGGTWGKGYAAKVKEEANRISNLKDYGEVTYRQSNSLIDNCLVLLSTSEYEGYPNIFKEAWLCGKPVVSMSPIRFTMIEKERLGALTETIEETLIALKELIENKDIYNDVSRRAKIFSEKEFSLEKNSLHLERILLETMKK
ncbi:MAG: glycosyltransferase family 4 protein [Candidatus Coatesbacteria bacterium]|nr:glycosyltransferase family 4 protein [Candidatus Coatesbacteria bacterium]